MPWFMSGDTVYEHPAPLTPFWQGSVSCMGRDTGCMEPVMVKLILP